MTRRESAYRAYLNAYREWLLAVKEDRHNHAEAWLGRVATLGPALMRAYCNGARITRALALIGLCVLANGCVSARAEYDPATGRLALNYWRLGDIEIEASATRDAATGNPVVSIHSVSQAAALNTAVAAMAKMLEKLPTP